jgi:hypothetical protein
MNIFTTKTKDPPDIPMREFLERIIDERDRQYDMRARAAEIAVQAALLAQKEQTKDAFAASEKAIVKAEQAQTAYNVAHNDLSRKLDEQNKATIPRPEITALFGAFDQKLDAMRASFEKDIETITTDIRSLRESRSETGGAKINSREIFGYIIAIVGVLIALSRFLP